MTPAEAEASALELLEFLLAVIGPAIPNAAQRAKPFGSVTHHWQQVRENMREGDELWEVCSAQQTWNDLAGRYVIQLMRSGQVVVQVCLMKS